MNDAQNLSRIEEDIRVAPEQKVIYLEGKTDLDLFFALLGLHRPADGIHQGILVKGLRDEKGNRGSGSSMVKALVDVATRSHWPGVFGIVDGDGSPLSILSPQFDSPYLGPLFFWKAYCIENLLAKTGWPQRWGTKPDWQTQLSQYGPYVALNRIGMEVRSILIDLGLEKYSKPIVGGALKSAGDIMAALEIGKGQLQRYDAARRFHEEFTAYEATLMCGLDETHTLLNGKWILKHLAPTITKQNPDQCQYDWCAHAVSFGGLPEVRDWWERVTGSPP